MLFFLPGILLLVFSCIEVSLVEVSQKRLKLVATNPGWQWNSHLCS